MQKVSHYFERSKDNCHLTHFIQILRITAHLSYKFEIQFNSECKKRSKCTFIGSIKKLYEDCFFK
ncbi:hypothetical protein T4B_15454 [Trichinella pseudospiralis]|uniref:Uncharacterized protein n=1 Tax=Trichinella pseudospiralis TaxID=6337 RepID=A0A0V1IY46_TRIPS|nr:hypothetical protein T4B_15454 [Trichinella pseudospiralis]KRZ33042.1 hypothetical protein T4C_4598 [Trichinella pseudospiralis]